MRNGGEIIFAPYDGVDPGKSWISKKVEGEQESAQSHTLCMNRPPRLTLDHVWQNKPNRRTENAGKRQATNMIGVTETDIEMIENHSSQHPQEQD